jgi:hypothetical protein
MLLPAQLALHLLAVTLCCMLAARERFFNTAARPNVASKRCLL